MSRYFDLVDALTPPPMSVTNHKVCTTRAQHDDAYRNLQPGDWVDCQGISFVNQVNYQKALTNYAKFTFTGCTWHPQSGLNGIWVQQNSSFLQFFGAEMALGSLARNGILQNGPSHHIVIDGFVIHGSGGGGLATLPVYGDIHHCWYRNEVYNISNNLSYDPHADKGSGLHCMLTGDAAGGSFHDNLVAIYGHDCTHGGGSVLEQEEGFTESHKPYNNINYVKADSMLWYSTTQTGGNGVNLFGWLRDITFPIVEVSNMAGKAVHCLTHGGNTSGLIWPNVVVLEGSACNFNQNPHEYAQYHGAWMPQGGVIYRNVTSSATCVGSPPPTVSPLTAYFTSNPSTGTPPLTVNFADNSLPGPGGAITGWSWTFGDGNTSNLQNPTNVYAVDGIYPVTLTVTSPDGTSSMTHNVTVSTAPVTDPGDGGGGSGGGGGGGGGPIGDNLFLVTATSQTK